MKTPSQRRILRNFGMAAATVLAIGVADDPANAYPDRPIEFIVMWPAGGGADTASRIFTERLEQVLETDVVVRNMPGGGGSIGYTAAKAATPGGYTLVVIQGDLPKYEPLGLAPIAIDDFEIFAAFAFQSPMLVVRADSEWESLQDFVDAAKADSGTISVGTTDIGGVFHQPFILFAESAGIDVSIVAMEGSPQQTVGLLGGHIDAAVTWVKPNISYVENGELRFLAYMASERHADFPDVPTVSELGFAPIWEHPYGVGAPKGTPEEVRTAIEGAAREIWDMPDFAEDLERLGLSVMRFDSEAYRRHMLNMQADMERVLTLIVEEQ